MRRLNRIGEVRHEVELELSLRLSVSAVRVSCCGLLLFQSQNAPMNSVTKQGDIEVDQKTQLPTTQPQVGKKLCVMNRRQMIDGFKLHHHRLGNNQVHAIPTIQSEAL